MQLIGLASALHGCKHALGRCVVTLTNTMLSSSCTAASNCSWLSYPVAIHTPMREHAAWHQLLDKAISRHIGCAGGRTGSSAQSCRVRIGSGAHALFVCMAEALGTEVLLNRSLVWTASWSCISSFKTPRMRPHLVMFGQMPLNLYHVPCTTTT